MALEIERKYLLKNDDWRNDIITSHRIRQGYMAASESCVVRVRTLNDAGYLTIKGKATGFTRAEFEYPIAIEDADQMLDTLCPGPLIEKTRYNIDYAGKRWVIDEFDSLNAGLIVAEIELESEQQHFESPPWIGAEVSHDFRYSNSSLASVPWTSWPDHDRPTAAE